MGLDLMYLALNRDHWQALVNLWAPQKVGNFMIS